MSKKKKFSNLVAYKIGTDDSGSSVATPELLKKINSLKKNGPNKKLTADDVHIRTMLVMGEEPTSKMSIHPEGVLNNKTIRILSQLSKGSIGAGMLDGHNFELTNWGRIFDAKVLSNVEGYTGSMLKIYFYFNKNDKGNTIAEEIDSGVRAEGSISYTHSGPFCSICHGYLGWSDELPKGAKLCRHHLVGETYSVNGEEQVCYWYPGKIKEVFEVSHVFKRAYPKTKSDYAHYSDELVEGFKNLDSALEQHKVSSDESFNLDADEKENSEKENSEDNLDNNLDDNSNDTQTENTETQTEGVSNNENETSTDTNSSETESNETPEQNSESTSEGNESSRGDSSKESKNFKDSEEQAKSNGTNVDNVETASESEGNETETKLSVCFVCNFSTLHVPYKECPKCGLLCDEYVSNGDLETAKKSFNLYNEKFKDNNSDIKIISDKTEVLNLLAGEYSVQPLLNGLQVKLTKIDDNIKLVSHDKDVTDIYSNIIESASQLTSNSVSILGEIIIYNDKKRVPLEEYEDVLSNLSNECTIVFIAYDVTMNDSENIESLDYLDRIAVLSEILKLHENTIVPCLYENVSHSEKTLDLYNAVQELKTINGALIKKLDSNSNDSVLKFCVNPTLRITLEDIKTKLDKQSYNEDVYLTGDLVLNGFTSNSLQFYALNEDDQKLVKELLGDLSSNVVFSESLSNINIQLETTKKPVENNFTIHSHIIGDKVHHDLRFSGELNSGYTFYNNVSTSLFQNNFNSINNVCQKKSNVDLSLMSHDGFLKSKSSENPTYRTSFMRLLNSGSYELIKNEDDFTEIIFKTKNEDFSGRYFISPLNIKCPKLDKFGKDDISQEKMSVFWKAKDQENNSITNPKVSYKVINNCLIINNGEI